MFKLKEGISLFGGEGFLTKVTGNYGTVSISGNLGSSGGYAGYSINDGDVFMSNGSVAGLYNDVNNEWYLYGERNGKLRLFNNGVEEARTDGGFFLANNQMRSPIFYDNNDTNYYTNQAGTSNFNTLNVGTINRSPTVTLSGDVTGSATMTNLGSINIVTAVANDSHTHSNYVLKTGDTMTGQLTMQGTSPQIKFEDTDHGDCWIHVNSNRFYVLPDRTSDGGWETPYALELNWSDNTGYLFASRIFTNDYHPNADKWTTARTNTVTLTGDVTGSGSASVDGSGNWTVSVATTVANDSHDHTYLREHSSISSLDSAWQTRGTGEDGGLQMFRYQAGATGQPVGGNNANWLMNIYSHAGSSGNYPYGRQLAGTDNEDIYTRKVSNGSFGTWRKIWHDGNFNPSSYATTSALNSYVLKAGDTMTGPLTISNTSDVQLYLNGNGSTWAGIRWTDSGGYADMWCYGATGTFALGGGGSSGVSGKRLHVDGATSIGSGFDSAGIPTDGLRVQGEIWDNNANIFSAYRHSGSDFADGTLVQTDIPATAASGASFVIEVTGKSYSSEGTFDFSAQGYLYNSTIINYSGYNNGDGRLTYIKAMEYNGNLCFWWPRISYWNSFEVRVRDAGGNPRNRVTTIGNATDPSTATKKVQINLRIGAYYGRNQSTGDLYATRYYDSNNTGYYSDPASTSNYNTLNVGTINRNPTVTLSGDVTGAATMTNLGSINITTTVANDSHSHSNYVLKAGDTMTGTLTTTSGNNGGLYVGSGGANITSVTPSSKDIVVQDCAQFRMGGASWDWNSWAGWRWDGGTNAIYFGGPASSAFTSNASPPTPPLLLSGISYTQSDGSMRAPIFYDSNDTSRYLDPNSSSVSLKANGALELYRAAGNDAISIINGARINTLCGTGYGFDSYLYGHTDGYVKVEGVGTSGLHISNASSGSAILLADGSVRSPIFYDSNNTAYYVDPHATSQMLHINMNNGNLTNVNNISIADPGPGEGITWAGGNGWSIYESPNDLTTNSAGNLQFVDSGVYKFRIDTSGNTFSETSSRAQVFYDSNNTNYYCNPAGASRFNETNTNYCDIVANAAYGLRFWDGNSGYRIHMSSSTDTTNGGRVAGETTSDYNMYFTMSGGTNRGFVFRNANAATGAIAGIDASGNARFEGDVVAYSASDKRLKENIKPIDSALDKVSKLGGYEFDWNDKQTVWEDGKHDVGVIAQEVLEVMPEAVKVRSDSYLGVDYEKLVPLLIEAVKEQQTQIEALTSLTNELQAQIKSLKEK